MGLSKILEINYNVMKIEKNCNLGMGHRRFCKLIFGYFVR
jgi:hypothetical protein